MDNKRDWIIIGSVVIALAIFIVATYFISGSDQQVTSPHNDTGASVQSATSCPSIFQEQGLVFAHLYDGPPSNHVDLTPVSGTSTAWDHLYPSPSRTGYYLGCYYEGPDQTVPDLVIKLPDATDSCWKTQDYNITCSK